MAANTAAYVHFSSCCRVSSNMCRADIYRRVSHEHAQNHTGAATNRITRNQSFAGGWTFLSDAVRFVSHSQQRTSTRTQAITGCLFGYLLSASNIRIRAANETYASSQHHARFLAYAQYPVQSSRTSTHDVCALPTFQQRVRRDRGKTPLHPASRGSPSQIVRTRIGSALSTVVIVLETSAISAYPR